MNDYIKEIRESLEILKIHFLNNGLDNWWEIANIEIIERHLNSLENEINRLTSI